MVDLIKTSILKPKALILRNFSSLQAAMHCKVKIVVIRSMMIGDDIAANARAICPRYKIWATPKTTN